MSKNPFKEQFDKWWSLVTAKETWDLIKEFFLLLWEIGKETFLMIGYIIFLVVAAIGWLGDRIEDISSSVQSFQNKASETEDGNLVSEAGKSLWLATKQGADKTLQTARATLDIKVPEKKTKEEPPKQGTGEQNKSSKQQQTGSTTSEGPKAGTQASGNSETTQDPSGTQGQGASDASSKQTESNPEPETVYEDAPQ